MSLREQQGLRQVAPLWRAQNHQVRSLVDTGSSLGLMLISLLFRDVTHYPQSLILEQYAPETQVVLPENPVPPPDPK
jgi:hypothetical protein